VQTDCSAGELGFQAHHSRVVIARFDADNTTSDGGILLLREVAERTRMLVRFARCFADYRDEQRIEHSVEELLSQRILGIACGYEDVNDHDTLRSDPLLAVAVGKADPTGVSRARLRDQGHPLAGKSTLNRLELTAPDDALEHRYCKIAADGEAIDRFFVDHFTRSHKRPPREVVLDLDATDDPIHGSQEGRFFHGYYGCYCYLPLYIFAGSFLLCARLRVSNIDASAGALQEVQRIVAQLRARWPKTRIILRADSGFARDELMTWCRDKGVDYVFGLAKNDRLIAVLEPCMTEARRRCERTGKPARVFLDFRYRTRDSWSEERRVVGKAEVLPGKDNPRFVVTSLSPKRMRARRLYEKLYCARGDMENRIKEQQLDMFADRTSTHWLRSNQLRLYLSSVAYMLVNELRRLGLRGTQMAKAQCGTIRARLLKIGGQVKLSVRRVLVSLSSAFPLQDVFAQAVRNLARAGPMPQ
jgi:hypothetical protein